MATISSPRLGIPAPDGNERVMDGDNAMLAIANHLDSLATAGVPLRLAGGSVTVPAGSGATNTAAVTFPAGRFTGTPFVIAGAMQNTGTGGVLGCGGATSTGVNIITGTATGTGVVAVMLCHWIALQV